MMLCKFSHTKCTRLLSKEFTVVIDISTWCEARFSTLSGVIYSGECFDQLDGSICRLRDISTGTGDMSGGPGSGLGSLAAL